MGEVKLNTNLASEFYVMSMLHRLGINAVLTMGNKKATDIIVYKKRKSSTIDVKGLQGTSTFPVGNCITRKENHYYVFVSFLGKIKTLACVPEVYIVPSLDIDKKHKELEGKPFVHCCPQGRKVIQYRILKKLSKKYLNRWKVFI